MGQLWLGLRKDTLPADGAAVESLSSLAFMMTTVSLSAVGR